MDSLVNHITRAMELEPVITCILENFEVSEIKKLRFVSKEWDASSRNLLRKRSKIVLGKDGNCDRVKTPFNVSDFFRQFSKRERRLWHSFCIYSESNSQWKRSDLDFFFSRQRNHIKEIELKNVCIMDDKGKILESFDITPWIKDSSVARSQINNCKLVIDSWSAVATTLVLDWSAVTNIRDLKLKYCNIPLKDNVLVKPKYLELTNVRFFKSDQRLKNLVVNSIVDLSTIKRMTLVSCYQKTGDLVLDVGEHQDLCLDFLFLSKIKIKRWGECRWTVKQLTIKNVNMLHKTQMRVDQLCCIPFMLDVSALPNSMKTLQLDTCRASKLSCTKNISFPKCTQLKVDMKFDFLDWLGTLVNFPQLVDLKLQNGTNIPFSINLGLLPKSIKSLTLGGLSVKDHAKYDFFVVENLIVKHYTLKETLQICRYHVQTKSLFLYMYPGFELKNISLLEFFRDIKSYCTFMMSVYFDIRSLGKNNNFNPSSLLNRDGKTYFICDVAKDGFLQSQELNFLISAVSKTLPL